MLSLKNITPSGKLTNAIDQESFGLKPFKVLPQWLPLSYPEAMSIIYKQSITLP